MEKEKNIFPGIIKDTEDKLRIYLSIKNSDGTISKEKSKVKEYNSNGKLTFDGIYLHDKKWIGNINIYNEDELIFDGEYLYGEIFSGKGLISKSGIIFKGEYINCEKNGYIKDEQYSDLTFEGNFINGLKEGYGKKCGFNEIFFEGEFVNNERNGKGKEYYNTTFIR